ncbi:hypothetical protein CA13_57230 [Planctomycetes bacterium CA13]|uniref:Glycosyl-hydrolase family 116 catalytic region domain-containing protein n=1 Tax=Novipirellula herctigrandis TaxID=2527986 RepID=A0A5C5ZAV3_9BACT|nr:hypothetical protein CA13_57230 [Planctomycetes bacterium CA13]
MNMVDYPYMPVMLERSKQTGGWTDTKAPRTLSSLPKMWTLLLIQVLLLCTPETPLLADQPSNEHYVPAEKHLEAEWISALFDRGERKVFRGEERYTIGMPCGGIGAGQLYVRGDGTLARWWIFNEGISTDFRKQDPNTGYRTFRPVSRLQQGFAIAVAKDDDDRVGNGEGNRKVLPLSQDGFDNIGFIGEYPIATILYEGAKQQDWPVKVVGEVFSPFVPLDTKASGHPATIIQYTVTNESDTPLNVKLGGWLQNAVMINSDDSSKAQRQIRVVSEPQWHGTYMDLIAPADHPHAQDNTSPAETQRVKMFDNFESAIIRPDGTSVQSGSLEKWTVEGDAFDSVATRFVDHKQLSRIRRAEGQHLIASGTNGDNTRGTLTSIPFMIAENNLVFSIGYRNRSRTWAINVPSIQLLVDGKVVRTATPDSKDSLTVKSWNVQEFVGLQAQIKIIDEDPHQNILVDQIYLTNLDPQQEEQLPVWHPEFGNMTLAALDPNAVASAAWDSQQAFLTSLSENEVPAKLSSVSPISSKPCGTVTSSLTLAKGESKSVRFFISWYFPNHINDNKGCPGEVGRMYANWFDDSLDVVKHLAKNIDRLDRSTHTFRDSLYLDTTLPYWLAQRSMASTSTLASDTVEWWKNGRFYSWEGVGFCIGTCGHVWNYAQGPARLFPDLERSVRMMQDFSDTASFKDSGRINFRGFNDNSESFKNWGYIPDAQAGYVLKAYREHLMSADNQYLNELYPRIKRATEYLIERDGRHGPTNGILEGLQHLTDSLGWGPNTFSGSLYLAALRAAEEMARVQHDDAFADTCHNLFESGRDWGLGNLWNGEYFIHKYSPAPEGALPDNQKGRSYGDGCLSDQVFGQNWAHQLGLGYVYPKPYVDGALRSVFKYNWTPDVATVYKRVTRRFILLANEGEAGMVGITYPKGDPPDNRIGQNDDPWTGYEYQAASHMIWEGLLQEGLSIAYGVHQRYDGSKHNPWCEIEGGDHYSRAMASWSMLLAASGFRYDGPAGEIGFAPRMMVDDFRCFFSGAEGWGALQQQRTDSTQTNSIAVKWGQLRLQSLVLSLPKNKTAKQVTVTISGEQIKTNWEQNGTEITITLLQDETIRAVQSIEIHFTM